MDKVTIVVIICVSLMVAIIVVVTQGFSSSSSSPIRAPATCSACSGGANPEPYTNYRRVISQKK
jgi:hypothetical protein